MKLEKHTKTAVQDSRAIVNIFVNERQNMTKVHMDCCIISTNVAVIRYDKVLIMNIIRH